MSLPGCVRELLEAEARSLGRTVELVEHTTMLGGKVAVIIVDSRLDTPGLGVMVTRRLAVPGTSIILESRWER